MSEVIMNRDEFIDKAINLYGATESEARGYAGFQEEFKQVDLVSLDIEVIRKRPKEAMKYREPGLWDFLGYGNYKKKKILYE